MMKSNYQYPLFSDWSLNELTQVFKLYQLVEDAYELNSGVDRSALLAAYVQFQRIVPAKSEQRKVEREFEHSSGYNIFNCIKAARLNNRKMFKMKD